MKFVEFDDINGYKFYINASKITSVTRYTKDESESIVYCGEPDGYIVPGSPKEVVKKITDSCIEDNPDRKEEDIHIEDNPSGKVDWYGVHSEDMSIEQARAAVAELRGTVVELRRKRDELQKEINERKRYADSTARIKDKVHSLKYEAKSMDRDYLTGYLCALSLVEGLIAESEVDE